MTTFLDAQFGMKKETTYGTPVVVDRFYMFTDASHADGKTVVQGSGLKPGARVAQSDRRTIPFRSAAGSLAIEVPTKGLGVALEACMGSGTSTLVSAGLYQQVFAFADAMPSYTFQYGVYDGTNVAAYTYAGCQVGSWALNCPEGNIVNMTLNWVGKSLATATALATASYPASSSLFTFAHAAFYVGGTLTAATGTTLASATGSALAVVKSFGLNVDNALKEGPQVGGLPTIRKPGLRAITGTVNVEYEGATFRDAIIADTPLVLLVTLTNGTDVVQVVIPEVRLNGNLPTSNGAERVTHDLAFEGLTSNLAIVTRTADAAL